MKLEPIIISLLDTDLYKFNMDQVIFTSTPTFAVNIISNAAMRALFLPVKCLMKSIRR